MHQMKTLVEALTVRSGSLVHPISARLGGLCRLSALRGFIGRGFDREETRLQLCLAMKLLFLIFLVIVFVCDAEQLFWVDRLTYLVSPARASRFRWSSLDWWHFMDSRSFRSTSSLSHSRCLYS